MSTANERQVGGNHYMGAEYQHWDWVADINMAYHAAVATKYISRHRRKNGDEDLAKAAHYIDKCEELKIGPTMAFEKARSKMPQFWRFVTENDLTLEEAHAIYLVQEGEWEAARAAVTRLALHELRQEPSARP